MNTNLIVLSIPIFFILMAIELLYSWHTQRKMYRVGDALANIGCGIFEQVTGVFLKVFTIGLYSWVYQNFRVFDFEMTPLMVFLLFLGVDFFYYWAHRMSHEVNLLWLGHVVHHQSEDYNLSVALRQGALQKLFTAPFFLPLAFLGFDDVWFLTINALNTLYQFWIHTEAIGKLGWMEFLFNTPSHHRVHHGKNPQYIDKNHGGSLIIWDRLFGTFEPEVEKPIYGVTTPIQTFNPLNAHWLPVKHLMQLVVKAEGFDKKILYLIKGPGWRAEHAVHKGSGNVVKFDFTYKPGLQAYLIAQFLLFLVFVAWFLFDAMNLSAGDQLGGALLIFIQLSALGSLQEGRIHSSKAELFRLVLYSVFFGWMGVLWGALLALVLAGLSFLSFRKLERRIVS